MSSALNYRIERRLPIALIRISGQLDDAARDWLRLGLAEALAAEPTALIVDLSGFTVDNPALLSEFSEVSEQARRWPGAPVLLCHATPDLAEGLRQAGIGRIFPTTVGALHEAATEPIPPRLQRRLAPTHYAPRIARELASRACAQWQLPHVHTAAQILSSELVTNAVRHAGTMIDLTISLRHGDLRVSVRDRFARPPQMQTPQPTDEGGRGLLIVDTVASAWGNVAVPEGKLVWATLSLAHQARPTAVALAGG